MISEEVKWELGFAWNVKLAVKLDLCNLNWNLLTAEAYKMEMGIGIEAK